MKARVNPKSTSNQSSKPCTVLQYPSKKDLRHQTKRTGFSHPFASQHSLKECSISGRYYKKKKMFAICRRYLSGVLASHHSFEHSSSPDRYLRQIANIFVFWVSTPVLHVSTRRCSHLQLTICTHPSYLYTPSIFARTLHTCTHP